MEFIQQENLNIETFRNHRIRDLKAQDTPTGRDLDKYPWVVLHMSPAAPLENIDLEDELILKNIIDFPDFSAKGTFLLRPMSKNEITIGATKDGDDVIIYARKKYDYINKPARVEFAEAEEPIPAYSYLRLFSDGKVEAVRTWYRNVGTEVNENLKIINSYRQDLSDAIPRFLQIMKQLGAELPVELLVTVVGARKAGGNDALTVTPKVLLSSFEFQQETDLEALLEPVFEKIEEECDIVSN